MRVTAKDNATMATAIQAGRSRGLERRFFRLRSSKTTPPFHYDAKFSSACGLVEWKGHSYSSGSNGPFHPRNMPVVSVLPLDHETIGGSDEGHARRDVPPRHKLNVPISLPLAGKESE